MRLTGERNVLQEHTFNLIHRQVSLPADESYLNKKKVHFGMQLPFSTSRCKMEGVKNVSPPLSMTLVSCL